MLVVIPTYKRLDSLPIVLKSLFNCDTTSINEKLRLLIVNNAPEYSENIKRIVDEFIEDNGDKWVIKILFREKSLPPIENWYSAVKDYAMDNEVVFLHGDDDLFGIYDLSLRLKAMSETDATFFISEFHSGLTYIDSTRVHLSEKISISRPDDFNYLMAEKLISTAFLGAQVFRYDKFFRESIELILEWLDGNQSWVSFNVRTLMLPYYLPICAKDNGAKVAYSSNKFTVRGTSLQERSSSPFGVPGWNSGFLSLLTLDFLRRFPFNNTYGIRNEEILTERFVNEWYFTFFIDDRLQKNELNNALKRIRLKFILKARLKSLKKVIVNALGMNAMSIRYSASKNKHVYPINHVYRMLKGE